jgi:hypothetical protein
MSTKAKAFPAISPKPSFAKRIAAAIAALAVVIGTFSAAPAYAAESCTKANAVKVVSGTKFVCKKVGGKLQWVKQGSNAVVNNQPGAPNTTTSAKEWTTCPASGRTSGSGDKGLVCVKYQGKLKWVKNSTLDTPIPKRPCRTEGQIGNWQGEVLLCTPSSSGKTWQIPVFDEEASDAASPQPGFTEYLLTAPTCHNNSTKAQVETLQGGVWLFADFAKYVPSSRCSAGSSEVNAQVKLASGTVARIKVYTSRWSWFTDSVTLGSFQNVSLTSQQPVLLTPATTRLTNIEVSGGQNIGLDFVSYTEFGDQSIFTFRVASYSSFFDYRNVITFKTLRGTTPLTYQPNFGVRMVPGSLVEIRVKRGEVQWDLTYFEFDFTGEVVNSNFTRTTFTKRVRVDFSWK